MRLLTYWYINCFSRSRLPSKKDHFTIVHYALPAKHVNESHLSLHALCTTTLLKPQLLSSFSQLRPSNLLCFQSFLVYFSLKIISATLVTGVSVRLVWHEWNRFLFATDVADHLPLWDTSLVISVIFSFFDEASQVSVKLHNLEIGDCLSSWWPVVSGCSSLVSWSPITQLETWDTGCSSRNPILSNQIHFISFHHEIVCSVLWPIGSTLRSQIHRLQIVN